MRSLSHVRRLGLISTRIGRKEPVVSVLALCDFLRSRRTLADRVCRITTAPQRRKNPVTAREGSKISF